MLLVFGNGFAPKPVRSQALIRSCSQLKFRNQPFWVSTRNEQPIPEHPEIGFILFTTQAQLFAGRWGVPPKNYVIFREIYAAKRGF